MHTLIHLTCSNSLDENSKRKDLVANFIAYLFILVNSTGFFSVLLMRNKMHPFALNALISPKKPS